MLSVKNFIFINKKKKHLSHSVGMQKTTLFQEDYSKQILMKYEKNKKKT